MDTTEKDRLVQYWTKLLNNSYRRQRRQMDNWLELWEHQGLDVASGLEEDGEWVEYEYERTQSSIRRAIEKIAEAKST